MNNKFIFVMFSAVFVGQCFGMENDKLEQIDPDGEVVLARIMDEIRKNEILPIKSNNDDQKARMDVFLRSPAVEYPGDIAEAPTLPMENNDEKVGLLEVMLRLSAIKEKGIADNNGNLSGFIRHSVALNSSEKCKSDREQFLQTKTRIEKVMNASCHQEVINFVRKYNDEFKVFAKKAARAIKLEDKDLNPYSLAQFCDGQFKEYVKSVNKSAVRTRGRKNSFSRKMTPDDERKFMMLLTVQEQAYIGFSKYIRTLKKQDHQDDIDKHLNSVLDSVSEISASRNKDLLNEGILLSDWIVENTLEKNIPEERLEKFCKDFINIDASRELQQQKLQR